ncbi:roadblock/LC7 domain-containing protein [Hydrogenophaga sp. 2FB]|uniref:roadblock/LC7 domain-containing protein n=1 Tax=Hydrogenophaga sp. 2FB TaxID=2502187 RepID=UPI0010F51BA1|nr:roadblock/LC7 domain-containing protein [Hydrogenophaga sp. 2FB]
MKPNELLSSLATHQANRKAQDALDAGLGVQAVVLATVDGFAVASAMSGAADSARIAALASSIASIGSVATQEAGLGRCTNLVLNTEQGFAVVRQFILESKELVLILVADGSSLLAQVMYQANQFERELVME